MDTPACRDIGSQARLFLRQRCALLAPPTLIRLLHEPGICCGPQVMGSRAGIRKSDACGWRMRPLRHGIPLLCAITLLLGASIFWRGRRGKSAESLIYRCLQQSEGAWLLIMGDSNSRNLYETLVNLTYPRVQCAAASHWQALVSSAPACMRSSPQEAWSDREVVGSYGDAVGLRLSFRFVTGGATKVSVKLPLGHVHNGTGLTPAASAPGMGAPSLDAVQPQQPLYARHATTWIYLPYFAPFTFTLLAALDCAGPPDVP